MLFPIVLFIKISSKLIIAAPRYLGAISSPRRSAGTNTDALRQRSLSRRTSESVPTQSIATRKHFQSVCIWQHN